MPNLVQNSYVLAVGLESGSVILWKQHEETWLKLTQIHQYLSHTLAVRRIRFNPRCSNEKQAFLATCGNDHTVRVFKLEF